MVNFFIFKGVFGGGGGVDIFTVKLTVKLGAAPFQTPQGVLHQFFM